MGSSPRVTVLWHLGKDLSVGVSAWGHHLCSEIIFSESDKDDFFWITLKQMEISTLRFRENPHTEFNTYSLFHTTHLTG